jgi:bacterioferritin (cytochrome b1)
MALDFQIFQAERMAADRITAEQAGDMRSVVERLLDHLEGHERSERDLLADYRQAAEATSDRGVRFLMGLVLEDEERHHRLMQAMARDIRGSLEWRPGDQPLPPISARPPDQAELLAQTLRFLKIERDSAADLKRLKKEVKRLDAGLLQLLVDGMEADTQKHIGILKYIQSQLEDR